VPFPSALLLALLVSSGSASPAESSARELLDARLIAADTLPAQARLLLEIAFVSDEENPELAELARQRLPQYEKALLLPLIEILPKAPARSQLALVELAGQIYSDLKGSDPGYRKVLRHACQSADPAVRHEAMDQVGRHYMQRLALEVADLYFLYPEDRIVALETLARLESRSGVSPGLDALASEDETLREQAVRTLARIGRPAALPLKERMYGDDPRLARDALRALLGFAASEDLSALHEYAERYGASDEEMGRRLTRAIAEIEVGTYEPPDPEDL
jgi:hypothetical protein